MEQVLIHCRILFYFLPYLDFCRCACNWTEGAREKDNVMEMRASKEVEQELIRMNQDLNQNSCVHGIYRGPLHAQVCNARLIHTCTLVISKSTL